MLAFPLVNLIFAIGSKQLVRNTEIARRLHQLSIQSKLTTMQMSMASSCTKRVCR